MTSRHDRCVFPYDLAASGQAIYSAYDDGKGQRDASDSPKPAGTFSNRQFLV
jgi:hypothetical protein